jgi:hypothetical protein
MEEHRPKKPLNQVRVAPSGNLNVTISVIIRDLPNPSTLGFAVAYLSTHVWHMKR